MINNVIVIIEIDHTVYLDHNHPGEGIMQSSAQTVLPSRIAHGNGRIPHHFSSFAVGASCLVPFCEIYDGLFTKR